MCVWGGEFCQAPPHEAAVLDLTSSPVAAILEWDLKDYKKLGGLGPDELLLSTREPVLEVEIWKFLPPLKKLDTYIIFFLTNLNLFCCLNNMHNL